MFSLSITPRFYETDAFGHINNTVIAGWFEAGRAPIFQIFTPDMDIKNLTLILARIEVDFVAQTHYGHDVVVKTGIEKVGNSSFVVIQEAWQNDALVAKGKAVQVYFDFKTQKSDRIPDIHRVQLEALI
ncbi:MAG: acyl-CoA thioesterase [Candidatus Saccharibacteria bacterium]|nr:acyl-CoA thioesterase [Moraxellaceae bacterium]